ncbi:4'-phosphopantetheine phosphatase isoform X1 [Neocloeon triangulifer]|uniref:4'-phosphopantetheine phosphatase isoform X1 n=1 Tax=Neocloeon triangulifer TaxID=2078957 RepID=UPI00286F80AA|nr:4'-phosphopantetheine phosphatase isoform X1 [Neocloeon triangulifer]XP_059469855.1 4'-phosphopantetheine phosphatase isoform X1 [Neocloeon triangulifer]
MAEKEDEMVDKSSPRSIELPDKIRVFDNLKNAKRFAIDIGGSLTKIAYYSTISQRRVLYGPLNKEESASYEETLMYDVSEGARLHFIKFETRYISHCLDFIQQNLVNARDHMLGKSIKATGGGSYKYTQLIHEKLGLSVDKEDELGCLIKGCNFLLRNMTDEAFTFCRHATPEYTFMKAQSHIFPYILVNIGSGVSVLKVESEDKYERIGGTATGGGTFWGLGSLLTSAKGFDELLALAEKGDHRNLDMLVKDIYGGDYQLLGLPGDLIASSFGKAMHAQIQKDKSSETGSEYSEADIARSLLFTISNDIGQIACLYAMMHNMPRVYFGGYFLRGHPLSMHTISFAINYWSRGQVQALFLRHEGYLGAIGAFLKGAEECDSDKYSWMENLAGSAHELNFTIDPMQMEPVSPPANLVLGQLEMDRWEHPVTCFPILADPENYNPDTVDLNKDAEARNYWLECFRDATSKYVDRAIQSQPHSETAEERAHKFRDKYLNRLQYLQEKPFAYGNLTVRSLLDTIEHLLKEFDFPDPYLMQKKQENETALALLPARLQLLDQLDEMDKHHELVKAILAGNMFDWGAKEAAALMSQNGFGLDEASSRLQKRPWLVDGMDCWLRRLDGPAHKCAAIFVDNSGIDIVLGIIPFARELLKRGTDVILCANSAPALNDVTHSELQELLRKVSTMCPIIESSLRDSRLVAMGTAQAGPCLDLSRVCRNLTNTLVQKEVDLIVLEGMGRALHTNLTARFTCECLKVAVIKNRWLANRLGGEMFSVICQYESHGDN